LECKYCGIPKKQKKNQNYYSLDG